MYPRERGGQALIITSNFSMSLRSSTTLLNDSIAFYKTHMQAYSMIVLLAAFLTALASYGIEVYSAGETVPPDALALTTLLVFVVIATAAVVLCILAYVALVLFTANPSQYPTATSVYREAKKYFFPYLWVAILTTLAVVAGFILLFVPGIIIGIWLMFSHFALLLEGKRGMEALKASKALVKGRWWPVFCRLLVFGALYLVLVLAVSFILGVIVPDTAIAGAIVDFVTTLVLAPIATIYFYFLYKDLHSSGPANAPVPASVNAPV